jgi:Tfp pilus assembly protein PilF
MELAELLFARGDLKEALGVANQLDGTEPTTYPLYQRASLTLRLRIAEAMKNARSAADYRRRITALNWKG